MVASKLGQGLLALTTLLSLGSAAPTLSPADHEQVAKIRARQGGKTYLASWTKSTISVPGGISGKPGAEVSDTYNIFSHNTLLTDTNDRISTPRAVSTSY